MLQEYASFVPKERQIIFSAEDCVLNFLGFGDEQ
jgi:hypothetical protein